MLAGLARLGDRFVACRSSNARALPADELATRARRWFAVVEARDDPREALARGPLARRAGARDGLALPPGRSRGRVVTRMRERLTVFGFAAFVLLAIVGSAFALGYVLGKLLL